MRKNTLKSGGGGGGGGDDFTGATGTNRSYI